MNLFLSHASEDKNDFVRPLAEVLKKNHQVWYDEYELNVGDSLLEKIDNGLKICDFGIVVLSHAFFNKKWPRAELDGLFAREDLKRKIILPIWHQITENEVKEYSPILAGRYAAHSSQGINNVANSLELAINASTATASFSEFDSIKKRFKSLEKDLESENNSKRIINSRDGVLMVEKAIIECFKMFKEQLSEIQKEPSLFKFIYKDYESIEIKSLIVNAPYNLKFDVSYSNHVSNSAEKAKFSIKLSQNKNYFGENNFEELLQRFFSPYIDSTGSVCWKDDESTIMSSQISSFLLEILITNIETIRNEQKTS